MFIQIYQMVLTTLMFIFSLISFSFMIASISRYLKNKSKKELETERNNLVTETIFIKDKLSMTTDTIEIEKLTNQLLEINKKIDELEK